MKWGVPVPWDDGHVFYVWYDALINYLTAASYGSDPVRFDALWGAAHHLIGKDILKFHCVWWPAMCLAAGIAPPVEIFVHGYLLMGGQKLGKTLIQSGVVGEGDGARSLKITEVSPLALADEFGVDPLRYHLLRDISLGSDGDFSYEGIVARYNADLANNLGNLVSRVATVVHSKCGGVGPACDPHAALAGVVAEVLAAAGVAWDRWAPQDALEATWRLIGAANAELETTEPWKMDPGPEVESILGNALEVLRIVAILISPAMPSTSAEIWRRIGLGAICRRSACRATPPGAATAAEVPCGERAPRSFPVASRERLVRLALPRAGGVSRRGREGGGRDRPVGGTRPGSGRAGWTALSVSGPGRPHPPRRWPWPERCGEAERGNCQRGRPSASIPMRRSMASSPWPGSWPRNWRRVTGPWWPSVNAGWTTSTSIRLVTCNGPPSRHRSRWPTRTP